MPLIPPTDIDTANEVSSQDELPIVRTAREVAAKRAQLDAAAANCKRHDDIGLVLEQKRREAQHAYAVAMKHHEEAIAYRGR